jgi:hypothetical protein
MRMSEAKLDPNIPIGCFLLGDVLRSLGSGQWFLQNIALNQMCEPLLGKIMGCLMHVAGDQLELYADHGDISYQKPGARAGLYPSRLQELLTKDQAEVLIDEVCQRAQKINEDWDSEFTYDKIYLFGSCLTDKPNPGDVDLALEVQYRDGDEVPEPSYYVFASAGTFDRAAGLIRGRGNRRIVAIHHYKELIAIGAPNRLIWTQEEGRVQESIIAPQREKKYAEDEARKKAHHKKDQAELDDFAARARSTENWPAPPILALDSVPDISRGKWLELQGNDLVLSYAHLMCLPESALRSTVAEKIAAWNYTPAQRAKAQMWAPRYVKAGTRYNPWIPRANGRLLRKGKD